MISGDNSEFAEAIRDLIRQRKLPGTLMPRQVMLLKKSFQRYADKVGQRLLDDILEDFQTQINAGLRGDTSTPRSDLLYNLTAQVGQDVAERLKFSMDIAEQVVKGAGHYLAQNADPIMVDEFPALKLMRFFRRMVPRGYKRKGTAVIPVPDDDWPHRWLEAGGACGDKQWLPWEGNSQEGHGIALKSSEIWIKLGTLRKDTLGYPFPPFAFNSGFWTRNVSRAQAEALGLIKPGEAAKPSPIDYDVLFAPIEEAPGTGNRPTKV